MSKVYKAVIYIDDINDMFNSIENIKLELENNVEDLTFTFEKVEEKDTKSSNPTNTTKPDTTEYINQVEDNYEWNTTDEYSRAIALHNYFAGDEVKK